MKRTAFYDTHVAAQGKMVEFAGWEMPLQYAEGIIAEHLTTRKYNGLFDVSHMGRIKISGQEALPFLRRYFSNDAATLESGESQYTILMDVAGGAIDDTFLFRYTDEQAFVLVVNAANRTKDWLYLQEVAQQYDVQLDDFSEASCMLALQGPNSEGILQQLLEGGSLPANHRNACSVITVCGQEVCVSRTGYTGEPICFELIFSQSIAIELWNQLLEKGANPVGLGARDTLRMEAGLPLYGHEYGIDYDDEDIPILACLHARFGIDLSEEHGEFVGREELLLQDRARRAFKQNDFSMKANLPKRIRPFRVKGRGIARMGARICLDGKPVGWVTSGTMVPYWLPKSREAEQYEPGDEHESRAIGLALIDSEIPLGTTVEFEMKRKSIEGILVSSNIKCRKPPYAVPVI